MKIDHLGSFTDVNLFIKDKLHRLQQLDASFSNIFSIMFENEENVLFEESYSYQIKQITYGDAKKNAIKYAHNIKNKFKDAPADSALGLYIDNGHEWIEIFWAILMSGFKPLFLNMRLSDESLAKALNDISAIGVISDSKTFKITTVLLSELNEEVEADLPEQFGSELFVMSSGTSNSVKLCAYSAVEIKNVLLQSEYIINSSELVKTHYNGDLKLLAFLPFYHIFGFVALYLWFGFYSRTFVKLNDLNPATIQNTIRKHHVTHIYAVPLFWQKTYDAVIKEVKDRGEKTYKKFLKGLELSTKPIIGSLVTKYGFKEIRDNLFGDSVAFMITGGSVIDKDVLKFFNAIGYHLSNGYGMSEIGITSVELSNNKNILNSASIGKPLPGVNFEIDSEGILSVSSNTLARYIVENGQRKDTFGKSFLTKDLAKEENGRYYLYGREDDLVVSITGENLNPNIIEESLKIENLNGICLINGKNSALPVLLMSVNKYIDVDKANKVLEGIKAKIVENNLNSQIGKVELITSPLISGDEFKMNRRKIEKDYYEGSLSLYKFEKTEEEESGDITSRIKSLFAAALNKDFSDINSSGDFFLDEGGTSLDYLIMASKINEEFGVNISNSETPLNCVKDIVNYIKEKL